MIPGSSSLQPQQQVSWALVLCRVKSMFKIFSSLILFIFLGYQLAASAQSLEDVRQRPYGHPSTNILPMSAGEKRGLINALDSSAKKYIHALNSADARAFTGATKDSMTVAVLSQELMSTKDIMSSFITALNKLQDNPSDNLQWKILVREFYVALPYIYDLDRYGIVKSADYLGLQLFMPIVFDRIIIPNNDKH